MPGEEYIKKAYDAILNNDFGQAVQCFEKAIELEKDNASYHYRLSITCSRSNKLPKAIEHAKLALQLEPSNESYHYHLQNLQARELIQEAGTLCGQFAGRRAAAVQLLKKAIELDPLAEEGYLLLSGLNAEMNDYHSAIYFIQEVIKLNPQHAAARDMLAEYRSSLKR